MHYKKTKFLQNILPTEHEVIFILLRQIYNKNI